jgi:hypothetical protein
MIWRIVCVLFALVFLGLVGLSVHRLLAGMQRGYFEARSSIVHRADEPVVFWMYFGLHVVTIPFCLAFAIFFAAWGLFAS